MNAGQVRLIANDVLAHLERARETEDTTAIREHLDKAIAGINVLLDLADVAGPPLEGDR
jgi:hypothetical protein